jgi:16S rRNA (cytidine1402-2'-O)-methyltransferase
MKTLYIVATPIGNLQDITLRAIQTLRDVDIIVCEDKRVTSNLLSKFEIKKPLVAVNEFNEEQKAYEVLKNLQTHNIALVSDAGTPLISDPGFRIVNEAKKKGFKVIPIPGPSAVTAALSTSGLPTDKFMFLGFLPKTPGKAKKILENSKNFSQTIVFYESPHRIIQTLNLMLNLFGNIEICLSRELTKIYEEITTQKISEFLKTYEKKSPKGEFVILFNLKARD